MHFGSNNHTRFQSFLIIIPILSLFLGACSSLDPNTQTIDKLDAEPFVTRLYDRQTKTVAITVEPGAHISWMGIEKAADHGFFQIQRIEVNGVIVTPDKAKNSFYSDISVATSIHSTTPFPEQNRNKLFITVSYNPLAAPKDVEDPHLANLIINFNEPDMHFVRVQMNGFVKGVCTDCTASGGIVYTAKDSNGDGKGDMDFYLCDSKAIPADIQSSEPLPDNTTPTTPYNLNIIEMSGDFTFYPTTKNTVIISSTIGTTKSTVPDFVIPVPGGKPVPTVNVSLKSGTQVECPMDAALGFACSKETNTGIDLSILGGLLATDPMQLTTGKVTPSSRDCAEFGTWQGKGALDGKGDVTVVAVVKISETQPPEVAGQNTGIEGALGVAVIELAPKK